MPRVIHEPDQHNCQTALQVLGRKPVGTIAECDCGRQYRMADDQRDGRYWVSVPTRDPR